MGINALIVDDSAAMRSVIRKVMKLARIDLGDCMEAENGEEALKILSQEWIDIILTDIHMPVMDGIELLRRIQMDELAQKIPVIVISTESRSEMIEKAKSLGAKAHITKPFQPETIKNVLESLLGVEYEREFEEEDDGGMDF